MDENVWKITQMGMWLIGIQTTVILAVLGAIYASFNRKIDKLEVTLIKKIDSLDEKVTDVDRRLCRLEGAFSSKDCCMIKDDRHLSKAE